MPRYSQVLSIEIFGQVVFHTASFTKLFSGEPSTGVMVMAYAAHVSS
jgi:hypothetical protein